MQSRIRLDGIDPASFQHPYDRQAVAQLAKLRGFDMVTRKFLEYGFERLQYVLNIASAIRVNANQMPGLHAMLVECCAVLDVSEPELYVAEGSVNAFTAGATRPFIVLQTGLINAFTDEEVMAVLAHEVGHIKCGHVLYKSMAQVVSAAGEFLGEFTLGIGALLAKPIEIALRNWDRRSELSADRAALLVMQEPHTCMRVLMKLAGGAGRLESQLSLDEFMNQVHAYTDGLERSTGDRIYRLMAGMYRGSNPFTIERAHALSEWASGIEYRQILNGQYTRLGESADRVDKCQRCRAAVLPIHQFCAGCGQALRAA
ncbi:MAG TPA: M48 family metallopeptidase [Chloroflexota bacterium]|jgi:Zn-dependent protease with chaperone function